MSQSELLFSLSRPFMAGKSTNKFSCLYNVVWFHSLDAWRRFKCWYRIEFLALVSNCEIRMCIFAGAEINTSSIIAIRICVVLFGYLLRCWRLCYPRRKKFAPTAKIIKYFDLITHATHKSTQAPFFYEERTEKKSVCIKNEWERKIGEREKTPHSYKICRSYQYFHGLNQ